MIKLLKGLKPFTLAISGILIFIFIQSMSELYLPTLMGNIIDQGVVKSDTTYILRVGALMVLVTAIGTICSILASYLASKAGMGFGRNLRNQVFTKVESFSLREFDDKGTSSLITRTTNDITQVQNVSINILRMFLRAPIMAVGGIIMAIYKDAKLSIILIGVVIVLVIVISIVAKYSLPLFKSMQKKIDHLNLVLRERLTGVRVIRAFNRTQNAESVFSQANSALTDNTIKVNKIMALLMPLMMFLMNITTVMIIWFASKRIDMGAMQVGDLIAYIQYVMQIMFSLIMFTMLFVMIPRASVSANRINEVLDLEPEIKDLKALESWDKKGYLEFKNVSFKYHGAEENAIENISFKTSPGEVTGIIGGTGSGKTTLVNMIPRFYDVKSGEVIINGIKVTDMTQKQLRDKIGFVPQKSQLFSGSIKDNITFGSDHIIEEDIEKSIRIAQAEAFINKMEKGLDAELNQGGTNLSGGQKQRISIARALYRKPEIYVFDDSFSALDFKTDAKLRKSLFKETANSTVLIVAQRITTVMQADQIIVLNEGKIVDKGTHKDLLKNSKIYKEIVYSQMSEEEIS